MKLCDNLPPEFTLQMARAAARCVVHKRPNDIGSEEFVDWVVAEMALRWVKGYKYKPPLQTYLKVSARFCAKDIVKKWVLAFRSNKGARTIVHLDDAMQRPPVDDLGTPPTQEHDFIEEQLRVDRLFHLL